MTDRADTRRVAVLAPGGLAASAAVLGDVMAAVKRFLDDVAWTTAEPAVS